MFTDQTQAELDVYLQETSDYLQDVEVEFYKNYLELNRFVTFETDFENHPYSTKMKSEYSNDGSVSGTPLSYFISLYDKKHSNNMHSISDKNSSEENKPITMNGSVTKEIKNSTPVKKSSLYFIPKTGVRMNWSDPDKLSQPDSHSLEDEKPHTNCNLDKKNVSPNDSYQIEVEVEINDIRNNVNESPLQHMMTDKLEDHQVMFSDDQEPHVGSSDSMCQRVLGQTLKPSIDNQDKLSVSPQHVSSSDKNSLNSDGGKSVKPILLNPSPLLGHHRRKSGGSNTELKSVTFSEDTVFNENKSKCYKKEKINLKDIYRGKIDSDSAYAKVNPMFVDDELICSEGRKETHSKPDNQWFRLTDDEKVATYPPTHGTHKPVSFCLTNSIGRSKGY